MAGMKFTFSLLVCAAAALMASGTLSELDLALLPQSEFRSLRDVAGHTD